MERTFASIAPLYFIRRVRAGICYFWRGVRRFFAHGRKCCETCCYASECIALPKGDSRFETVALVGGTNHMICMCGCSKRGAVPTLIRPWQPTCPAYMPWKAYYNLGFDDSTWMPPKLKELPAGN